MGSRFANVVLALRWATVATGAVLGLTRFLDVPRVSVASSILIAYSGFRTLRPFPRPGRVGIAPALLAIDFVVIFVAVALSGGWDGPFVFTLLVPILVAGFHHGYAGGLWAAAAATAGMAGAAALSPTARATPETTTQVVLVFVASAVVAGFARRLSVEAEARQEAFSDRMARLAEANALLEELTQVAKTLPSSLDLGDALAAAMGHLRQMLDFSGAAVLVFDAPTRTWRSEASAGLPAPAPCTTEALPSPARAALERKVVVAEPALDPADGRSGFWPQTRSGLYAPLVARRRVVALAAVEHSDPGRFGPGEANVLGGLADPLALAIDNALAFERLRTLGAESERDRLARDLHDHIGQGLAYVGLELDRLARLPDPKDDLVRLRQEVGGLLAEVRETLHRLRARVSESSGLADLAGAHLARFGERTGIRAAFDDRSGGRRLPIPVEQELWRILQEALANVERHAGAGAVEVRWEVEMDVDGSSGVLAVHDDGRGFDPGAVEGAAASGMMAMRERANAIGAELNLESSSGAGTTLTAHVEVKA